MGQLVFFTALLWVSGGGAFNVLREVLFLPKVPRSAEQCRAELDTLRARLREARVVAPADDSELAMVRAFRAALGDFQGRDWDIRVLALVDGCPAPESAAAYSLARLRAADEAMLRLDALEGAPARRADARALRELGVTAPPKTP